jgi:hypothetical protein
VAATAADSPADRRFLLLLLVIFVLSLGFLLQHRRQADHVVAYTTVRRDNWDTMRTRAVQRVVNEEPQLHVRLSINKASQSKQAV